MVPVGLGPLATGWKERWFAMTEHDSFEEWSEGIEEYIVELATSGMPRAAVIQTLLDEAEVDGVEATEDDVREVLHDLLTQEPRS